MCFEMSEWTEGPSNKIKDLKRQSRETELQIISTIQSELLSVMF